MGVKPRSCCRFSFYLVIVVTYLNCRWLSEIKAGLGRAILLQELRPAFSWEIESLNKYMKTYQKKFSKGFTERERESERERERERERQTDRQRQNDRKTDRQTKTDIHIDRETGVLFSISAGTTE